MHVFYKTKSGKAEMLTQAAANISEHLVLQCIIPSELSILPCKFTSLLQHCRRGLLFSSYYQSALQLAGGQYWS